MKAANASMLKIIIGSCYKNAVVEDIRNADLDR